MHEAQRLVRRNIKEQKERNRAYYDKVHSARMPGLKVGDPVYMRNKTKSGKLDSKWLPHYRIISQTGSTSYVIANQLTGKHKRVHANDIRLADLSELEKKDPERAPMRQTRLVMPPDEDSTDEESGDSEDESDLTESDMETETTEGPDKLGQDSPQMVIPEDGNSQRPRRTAKANAEAKIKLLQGVQSDKSLDMIIQKKLVDIFNSFSETLTK